MIKFYDHGIFHFQINSLRLFLCNQDQEPRNYGQLKI